MTLTEQRARLTNMLHMIYWYRFAQEWGWTDWRLAA